MTESVLGGIRETASGHRIGVASLNAEKSLNSLTLEMVVALRRLLLEWREDARVVCVFLQGSGEKAFCAGGDVRKVRESILACQDGRPNDEARGFFETEYRLDYLIHTYPKPIVLWGSGIVMGGGIGLLSGASHRVVTETSRLAMPEINIGLYPDVGGTWFLNHAPGRTGLFLGMTGVSLNAADALFVGLADRFIASDRRVAVLEALQEARYSDDPAGNHREVSRVLRRLEVPERLPASKVREHFDRINAACDADTAAEVAAGIVSVADVDDWWKKGATQLQNGCPVTAHLVFEQLRRGRTLSLPEVFRLELILSLQCCLHADFPEGVRALLVDKDGAPRWQHRSVAEVPADLVDAHFRAPWGDSANPLDNL
jgi:enoyl-CoA hydratase/carnithine racemase